MGKQWKQWQILFPWAAKSLWMVTAAMKLKDVCFLGEKLWQTDSVLKSRDITLPTKVPSSQSYGFSSSHIWMWELHHKEGWAQKNWCFWTVVLEKTPESPLDSKEIQPVHPKGNQSWIFIGRTDAEAETPILWPPDVKNWLIWKDPDAGKDWRQEEKGTTEDETVGWHHWLNTYELEQAPGDGEGQGSLVCCSPWDRRELDMIEWLNNNNSWWYWGSESACQCRGHEFKPWSARIPYTMEQLKHMSCSYWASVFQLLKSVSLELCSATRETTTVRSLCIALKTKHNQK